MDNSKKENKPEKENKRYVYIVSDATGRTCSDVVDAALSQFTTTEILKRTFPNVRTLEQIDELIAKAAHVNGIVVYTMVSPDARERITKQGRLNGVATVDLLGPLLTRFSDLLEISPLAKPGLSRHLDDDYFKRIEALDYTIKHDDGLRMGNLNKAEIVLLGVSRTTKTPVSIYLSYRGWKVANVPIIQGQGFPEELERVDPTRVVALTVKPNRLQLVRKAREQYLTGTNLDNYTELERVKQEVSYGLRLYRDYGCPVLDVSYKSIEETATEVMRIIYANTGEKRGQINKT